MSFIFLSYFWSCANLIYVFCCFVIFLISFIISLTLPKTILYLFIFYFFGLFLVPLILENNLNIFFVSRSNFSLVNIFSFFALCF